MNIVDFSHSAMSLLPPLVALGLAILTRRVLVSLGVGVLLGAFLLTDFSIGGTASYIGTTVTGLFIDDGAINSWNMSIVAFLILLGMTTALLTLSGGTRAFAEWAQTKIKSKRGAKLLAAFLGVFIFVDDYFNSLAVGSISRPVTDRFYVSRAKLAYILDSTAAPMCVLMPASSWGAYIITLIGGILVSHGVTEYTPLGAFMQLAPMNFYAVFALLMVFVVAWFQIDVGPMKKHELEASHCRGFDEGDDDSRAKDLNDELEIEESKNGRVADLVMPIVTLIVATFFFMLFTGYQALAADGLAFSVLGAFENTDVGMSLVYGGLVGFAAALIPVLRQRIPMADVSSTLWIGAKSMFGAILILLFAWSIGTVISDMATGKYLSTLVEGSIDPMLLPAILFLLAGVMAFSTGTSWGTFGIMLPIAGDLAAATDIMLMLPMLGAVLAGSVFGDHCSPISDTTILSSTGARCHHIDHVATQLPYALSMAAVSTIGFLVLGFTGSLAVSFMTATVAFIVACILLSWLSRRPQEATANA
ncbi:Na+/H+ antiporter NhaC family protein [Photobacterium sp. BZF1]|uniref:Na+/H+ antiporter n=1 Tax=Photobacterium rosenbergii TaxID=294936 RepID=A0A2T3NEB7_9GAMM|nr:MULTISPECIES: Na+/H+ antiporter NhaC family protein [Photobacterium]MBC7004647.1 Na+/H+ antiporter NhaC family protein [Photobacterium sp. BZF1]MBY5943654.1 Na+/H+ antiporter NhaC family protein [Photobacterium rosenbergii]PSW12720.1 Na+/H+ antiporter [Photobacterium rosenbergii]